MANTDWSLNDTVQPQDINAMGEEINQLREDVDNIEIPPASVTEAGIVKLSNATNSTSETLAATPRAVKSAYDAATTAQTTANAANTAAATAQARADSAFQLGNERKAEVVAALVAKGISASTSESWDSLIGKLTAIVNRGAQVITPGTANKAIPAGYHNGSGYVVGEPNLIAGNLPKDKTFWGIVGALERMTTAEKQAFAAAITGKGVPASVSDTNTVLAQKIGQIATGIKFATGHLPYTSGTKTITNLAFRPKIILCYVIDRVTLVQANMEARGYVVAYDSGAGVEYGSSLQGYLRDEYNYINFSRGIGNVVFGANSVSLNTPEQPYQLPYIVFGN